MSEEVENNTEEQTVFDVMIFGVVIGKATGWDQFGDEGKCFYDFVPEVKFNHVLCEGTFMIDFDEGSIIIEIPAEEGEIETEEREIPTKKFLELLVATLD